MEMWKNFMGSKILKYLIIYWSIIMFIYYVGYPVLIGAQGDKMRKNNYQNKEIFKNDSNAELIQKKFIKLYNQWQEHIQKPEVRISSRTQDYIDCKPYRDIIKLGKSALPYLIKKMEEGKLSSWENSQFFLWYAVREISGVNLVKEEIVNEQEIAERYITWWKTQQW